MSTRRRNGLSFRHLRRVLMSEKLESNRIQPNPMRPFLLIALASSVCVGPAVAQSGAEARAAARRHREANEAKILREFSALLSLPNVASNRDDIRRNADHLMAMLRQRGATAQILEVPDAPVSVYGEIRAPGATRPIAGSRASRRTGRCSSSPTTRASLWRSRMPGARLRSGRSRTTRESPSASKPRRFTSPRAVPAIRS